MSFKRTLNLNSRRATGKSENFHVNYSPPIELDYDKQYEIGMESCFLWYSWHNISEALGNNTFTYYNSKAWASITIPVGS